MRIEYLPLAWDDLDEIQNWYKKTTGKENARKIRNSILDYVSRLSQYPELGVKVPDEWLSELGYRMIVINKHVVIYRKEKDCIKVHFIADIRSDYLKRFYISGRVLHEDRITYNENA